MSTLKTALIFFFIIKFTKSGERKFPADFKFGVATSAFQIEGGWNADGKGASIWDTLGHNRSELVWDGSNADVTCNSYEKWEEDVIMIKNLGVDFYRLSLAWTRILPDATTTNINQAGIDYYNNIINKLQENGIETVITLFHWDLPQKFSALGGWTNPIVVQHFANFARIAFDSFGDRVKTWITINEPRLICHLYKGLVGDVTSNFPLGISEYLCTHNILKAHAEAYHIYDKEFRPKQNGKISLTLDFVWTEPANASNPEDVRAANQNIQFDFGIYANPIMGFDYPKIVKDRVAQRSKIEGFRESRLPKFTLEEKMRIKGTYDFLGINHYITRYSRSIKEPSVLSPTIEIDSGGETFFGTHWEGSGAEWLKVVPWGLRNLLKWVKNNYDNPEIVITENGYADGDDVLEDDARINYFKLYLNATLQAIIEDGVNVKAYTAWSLMDNYEWTSGYTLKFGLYHVNFTDPNRTRTPKKSVKYYKNVITTRTIS